MKLRKLFTVITTLFILFSMSVFTAFADHTQIYNLSDEEIYERTWKNSFDEYSISQNPAYASMMYYQLGVFLKSYNAKTLDVDITDVSNDFFSWWRTQYDGENIEWSKMDNGYIEYYTKTGEKNYWTYDETTDSYVCTDSKNNVIKSYKNVQNTSQNNNSSTVSDSTTNSYEITSNENNSTTVSSGNYSNNNSNTTSISNEPVTASPSQSEIQDGMSNGQVTILITIGVLILMGIIVIIVMLIKKKNQ